MSRKRKGKHEEHTNHEAWAIPYADLITLLLAFFVVMYAISSVNEGKYRVLSDSLVAAFRGSPRTLEPVQVGEKQVGNGADLKTSIVQQSMLAGQPRSMLEPVPIKVAVPRPVATPMRAGDFVEQQRTAAAQKDLERVADEVVRAMDQLVRANLVFVRRKSSVIEVEIRTDILFPSGSATLSPTAIPVIDRLAAVLKQFPNPIRVEGHTDSRPIATVAFPSNWELSAARAASVVHLFAERGLDPVRLSVIGHAQYQPAQSNATAAGRNANRRVVIVIMSTDGTTPDANMGAAAAAAVAPSATKEPAPASLPTASAGP
ncbi:MAG TPA: flagellar motor protein MotD [Steroidobacteraceae bacterium]|nr:flagellar motor protein MotD [Steroidobacteraceae bacterium]